MIAATGPLRTFGPRFFDFGKLITVLLLTFSMTSP
jgi:hypothetical protein